MADPENDDKLRCSTPVPIKDLRYDYGDRKIDYKKAMLMFYEQSNIAAFKRIFIVRFLFAVKTCF